MRHPHKSRYQLEPTFSTGNTQGMYEVSLLSPGRHQDPGLIDWPLLYGERDT